MLFKKIHISLQKEHFKNVCLEMLLLCNFIAENNASPIKIPYT